MRSVGLVPSVATLAGALAGIAWAGEVPYFRVVLVASTLIAMVAWRLGATWVVMVTTSCGYGLAGAILGATSAQAALHPSIRTVLDRAFGGFAIESLGPAGRQEAVLARIRLVEDAALLDFGVGLRGAVESVTIEGERHRVTGGVRLSVSGSAATTHATKWRAGRVIQAPVTFRRPTRYLNDGVPDFERRLALDGVTLNGSVKSGLLVEVVQRGNAFEESTANIRAHVRAALARHVGRNDAVASAIVTAILIGDRSALPDEVRERLQAAGTYHVIAISGGNIAILAAVIAGALMLIGAGSGRTSALVVITALALYALVVSAGPSVWRATLTAIVYLAARVLDHRSPPWNAMAMSAAVLVCASPLDVRTPGFGLTFGATAAILEVARRTPRSGIGGWALACVLASLAIEIVLLPINATAFSRVTVAGLALNLLAVPLMTTAQAAGLLVACLDRFEWIAGAAGIVAAAGARGLVESARLVDAAPWLWFRVPPPPLALVLVYYSVLVAAVWQGRYRRLSFVLFVACATAILTGAATWLRAERLEGLRLTMFDVGQGDSLLLQTPDGRTLMVDAGGAGFDGTAFDIGGRVLAPALWARGVRRLDTLVITHGDPDHIGGALAVVRDFEPAEIWQGIPVPGHALSEALDAAAAASGALVHPRVTGWSTSAHRAQIRVLHPPPADWQRPRVRNDDSLVLEVRYGDVAILLTGDIGAGVERAILGSLTPARIRILKVAHHGSRTSTSQALLDAWRPQIALIGCGRGNRFGHPAPEVIGRLESAGVRVYRTDRDGQITLDTDGAAVGVRTLVRGHDTKLFSHEDTKVTKYEARWQAAHSAHCQRTRKR
jgi:competence protein ComEC